MDHVIAVEDHVVQAANLGEALDGVVNRPAAVVDQRGGLVLEPVGTVPVVLVSPNVRTVTKPGNGLVLGVVGCDIEEDLDERRGIAGHDALEVVLSHLLGSAVLGEDALLVGPGKVAIELSIVAPQAKVVDRDGDQLVVEDGQVGERLVLALLDARNLHDGLHVRGEREVGNAGVARGLVAGGFLNLGDLHLGVATHGAAVAAGHLYGVLLSCGAKVLGGLHAAITHGVGLEGLGLAGLDGAALGSCPVEALLGGPTRTLVVVLGPGLLGGGDDMVVVGAKNLGDHVVGQVGNHLRVGNVNGLGALDDDCLDLLGAQNGAQASARGVGAAVHDARVREQVLARRADGGDAALKAVLLAQGLGGLASTLAPESGGILDADLVIVNEDVDRGIGLALDNQAVVAGVLEHGAQLTAAVAVDNQVILGKGGQSSPRRTTGQGNAGTGEGANSENGLVLLVHPVDTCGDLVVHDLVSKAHAAVVVLLHLDIGLFGDSTARKVDAGDPASPTVRGISHLLLLSLTDLAAGDEVLLLGDERPGVLLLGRAGGVAHVLPLDKLDRAVGALLGAAAARDALRGLAGDGVHHGHVIGARGDAGAATNALLGVNVADAVVVSEDGALRACGLAQGRLAHVAGADVPLARVVDTVAGPKLLTKLVAVVHVDAGGCGLGHAIVLKRAAHLAALAAGATGAVYLEHVGRGRIVVDLTLRARGSRCGGIRQKTQGHHARDERARNLHKPATGEEGVEAIRAGANLLQSGVLFHSSLPLLHYAIRPRDGASHLYFGGTVGDTVSAVSMHCGSRRDLRLTLLWVSLKNSPRLA